MTVTAAVGEGLAATEPAAVRLTGVTKSFDKGGVPVLDGIDLSVAPGEFVCLLGASGCGKSTLLNLIAGLDPASSGTIELPGTGARPGHAALMFQDSALFPWLTAGRNIELALKLRGVRSRAERRQEAQRLLEIVRLGSAYDKRVHELSGGMRQRVALARSLAQQADVLLMDEPFAALDAITRRELNEEILRIWRELGQTVVFITHDIDEAVFLADRVVVLGKVPAGIHSEPAIDLPRPRTWRETRRQAAFAALGAALMERIEEVSRPRADAETSQRPRTAQVFA
jgi:NitT/TauT family transport system ATP-binding protein